MENIFTTSQPFLKLAAVIGVFPMTFHGPSRKGELKTKWWNVVISITVFTTLVIFIFLQTMTSTTSKLPSKISSNAWYTLFNLEFIGHLILYIGQCYRRNHVLEFLKLLQSFDDRYIQLSCVEFNYRRQRMLVTSTTWFIVITAISMSALAPLYWLCKNKPELINYGISATFLLSNLLKMFYVSQFSFACTAITLRFEFMKKCIETPTKNAFISCVTAFKC
ncbi:CLUMA_CG001567, isoform A [Clunio marinus]|uniref:CLUMA_CG001567, isoform A n=1 Tax=Clunio marinus TaxID=568069 RepID=A0A1J1HJM8_9DIPT|nr:CLUMA_CG001567, isoform A [Clunio marinus]